jgi:hypothetical protein
MLLWYWTEAKRFKFYENIGRDPYERARALLERCQAMHQEVPRPLRCLNAGEGHAPEKKGQQHAG